MDGEKGEPVLVVRRHRSTSARTPAPRRSGRARTAETRYRHHGPQQVERPDHGPNAAGAKAGGHRVLVVDDEASIRLICSINFKASGWECLEAVDGEEALEQIRAQQPEIVLLDVMMPKLDGWEVAERLAEEGSGVPVVFLTARAELRDRERAHKLGAVGYLTKPLDPVRLPDAVAEILQRLERGEREQLRGELLQET
jgi:CheY-like chemotaxis protein